jgi:phosphohistidine phosphatase
MDLILWRHADAGDGVPDLARELTPIGVKQAARMAAWLLQRLPRDALIIASPAVRAQQTASALGKEFLTEKRLAPGASVEALLKAAGSGKTVVLVGHQPDLGRAAAHLVAGSRSEWTIEKGAAWWLSGEAPMRIRAVVSADLL